MIHEHVLGVNSAGLAATACTLERSMCLLYSFGTLFNV